MTISADYLAQQKKLHENPSYGNASIKFAPMVADILKATRSNSLSDYGAGKQRLRIALEKLNAAPKNYFPYDPVFPEYGPPKPADLVCCIDVLEHIETDCIDLVIEELHSITEKFGFFSIHTHPAIKVLDDGRNAHIIQAPPSWWLGKLIPKFEILQLQSEDMGFWMVVGKKHLKPAFNTMGSREEQAKLR